MTRMFCRFLSADELRVRDEVELGYVFAGAKWDRGFATEAAQAMRDLAFREMNCERLVSAIVADNTRSSNVARKLGFGRSGKVLAFGMTYDRYELRRIDWESQG